MQVLLMQYQKDIKKKLIKNLLKVKPQCILVVQEVINQYIVGGKEY